MQMMRKYRWALFPVIFFALYIAYINYAAQNVIYMDQIRMVELIEKYHNGVLTFQDLWKSQGGQHRHFGYQIYFMLNALFFDLNTIIDVNIIASILLIIVMIFSWGYNQSLNTMTTRKFLLFHFPVVLVGFGLIKWETALMGLGVPEYYGLAVLSILVTMSDFYLNGNKLTNLYKVVFIILMLTTLAVAMSALLPFYIALAFMCFYRLYHSKVNVSGKRRFFMIANAVLIVQFFIYTYNINTNTVGTSFNAPEQISLIISKLDSAFKFLLYAMSATIIGGETLIKLMPDSAILLLGLFALAMHIVALYMYCKKKYYTYTIIPGFMIIGSLLYMALILLGRFSLGEMYGMQSRYSLNMMLGLIGIVWCWALYFAYEKNMSWKITALSSLIVIVMGAAVTDIDELYKAKYRKEAYENMRRVIYTQDSSRYHLLQDDGPEVDNAVKILKKHDLNVFSDIVKTSGLVIEGDYYKDNGNIWCGENVQILVKGGSVGEVILKIYVPEAFYPNYLRIYDNQGSLIHNVSFDRAQEYTVVLKTNPEKTHFFRLKADRAIIPKALGINQDERALSFLILNIDSR